MARAAKNAQAAKRAGSHGAGVATAAPARTSANAAPPPDPAGTGANADDVEIVGTIDIPEGGILEVTGPPSGRRRAGRTFGREPVRIPLDDLDADALGAILSDPALSCAIVSTGDEKPEAQGGTGA